MKTRFFAIVILFLLLSCLSYAQHFPSEQGLLEDVVYLKNGSIIRGVVVGLDPNDSIKIRTRDASVFVYKMEEVQRIIREPRPANRVNMRDTADPDFDLALLIGYFRPSDEVSQEIYKGGFAVGGEITGWDSSGLGLGLDVYHFRKAGEPLAINVRNPEAKISITSISLTLMYRIIIDETATEKPILYFGIGGGIYDANEKLGANFPGDSNRYEESFSTTSPGFHILGGISLRPAMLEVRFSSAAAKGKGGLSGADVGLGGISISTGLRF